MEITFLAVHLDEKNLKSYLLVEVYFAIFRFIRNSGDFIRGSSDAQILRKTLHKGRKESNLYRFER
jgi:hypothetical protein